MIDESQINNWFTYHAPTQDQIPIYEAIRSHGREFAHVINQLVPDCADKTAALRKLREVGWTANAALATTPTPEGPVDAVRKPVSTPYQTATGFTSGQGLKDDEIAMVNKPTGTPLASMDDMVNTFVGKLSKQ